MKRVHTKHQMTHRLTIFTDGREALESIIEITIFDIHEFTFNTFGFLSFKENFDIFKENI